jgi:hypothetical protein
MYKYNTLKHCTTFAVHVRFEPSSPYMKFKRLNHCHDMDQRCGICHVLTVPENPIYLQENTVDDMVDNDGGRIFVSRIFVSSREGKQPKI